MSVPLMLAVPFMKEPLGWTLSKGPVSISLAGEVWPAGIHLGSWGAQWCCTDCFKGLSVIDQKAWCCFPVSGMCPVKHAEKLIVIVRKFHHSDDGCDVLTYFWMANVICQPPVQLMLVPSFVVPGCHFLNSSRTLGASLL